MNNNKKERQNECFNLDPPYFFVRTFLASTMQQVNHQSCTIPRNANDKKEDSTRGGSDGIITIIEKMEKQNEKMMEESQRMQEL